MAQVPIKLMTYNLANFSGHGNWEERKKSLAMIMQSMDSDVIGVQELRFDRNYYGTGQAQNAMIQLASLMPNYPYFMWQPNMVYSADIMEGVGIFSKYPIIYTEHVLIGSSEDDPNIRGVICSVISHPKQIFNFYVTHVSYDSKNQLPQAKRIWDFILKTYRYPYVIVADWNCDIEDGMNFLTGKEEYEGEKGNLTDWAESTGQPTFPSNNPSKRIDRILTSKEWTCKGVTQVIGKSESEYLEASDHCAFYGEYYLS